MKVLHIGKYYPPFFGGIEKVNFDLVEGLNKRSIHTDVLCFNHSKGQSIENGKYKILRSKTLINVFSTPISISFFWKLRRIKKDYDIIHIHLPNPIASIALQYSGFKGKVVLHWHSDIVKQKKLKLLYGPFERSILKRADKIIVTSPNYLEASESLKPYLSKCVVIPIGIDSSEFAPNPALREKVENETKGKKVIFSLGRLIYYKGFEYLIEAAKELPNDTIIYIGGVGELGMVLSQQIKSNNLEDRVKLLGKIPFNEISEYYRRADIFCLPSNERSEAFGVVLIEAMSFSCPIVCCDIKGSGVPWVARDKINALVVKPFDSKELSNALSELIRDNEKREAFSKASLDRYKGMFRLNSMLDSIILLYQDMLYSSKIS